jgi:hypothetical protein
MIDKNKVLGYIKMKGETVANISNHLRVAEKSFYRKLDQNKWKFEEIWKLTQILDVEFNDLLQKK